jgi:hypothetical protein
LVHGRQAAARQLALRRQLVDDFRNVAGEHLGELVAVDALAAGQLVELPLPERVLDLPPVDGLVGAGPHPRVDLIAEPLLLELLDDVGQLLRAAPAEDLREDVGEVVRRRHARRGLLRPLLRLGLRGPLGCLLLRGAFEHLLQDLAEDVHEGPFVSGGDRATRCTRPGRHRAVYRRDAAGKAAGVSRAQQPRRRPV